MALPKLISDEHIKKVEEKQSEGFSNMIVAHEEQKEIAQKSKEEMEKSGVFEKQIVTEITPFSRFWRAEEYHQKYLEKKGRI